MTVPLDAVDTATLETWFGGVTKASPEMRDAFENLRELHFMVARALLRDLAPSFDRDQALARLRESWHWSATALFRHGLSTPCNSDSAPPPSLS